jgi:hypothetical protein
VSAFDNVRAHGLVDRLTAYGPVPWLRKLAKLLPTISYGPARYGAILVAEEVLDRLQC